MPKTPRPKKKPPILPADTDQFTRELQTALQDRGIVSFIALHPRYGGIVFCADGVNRQNVFPYLAQLLMRSLDEEDIFSDPNLHHVRPPTDD